MHLEAVARVPFREWIDLKRSVILENGVSKVINCKYFIRKDKNIIEDLNPLRKHLEELGLMREAHLRNATSLLIPTEGYSATLELLECNSTVTLV
jgi:hypothetical protein